MKFNDAVSGAVLLALAIAILVNISAYPAIPGQNIGPNVFPGLLAVLLALCSLLLIRKGLAASKAESWLALGDWMRSGLHLRTFILTIASLVFYKGLRVPLPWGVLQSVQW